jgi:flagellar basal-body rod modification protein FlgD
MTAVGSFNPTGSTGASIASAQQSLAGDQTTFLKLLTTQLKNQDPLSPLDANQFTAQLVQMTGVQQQITTNQLLNQLVSAQGGVGNAVGLIGKQVTAGTSAATLQSGQANWSYSLDGAASDVTLQVVDSSGNTVWQSEQTGVGQGDHTFSWNGKDLAGLQRTDGTTYGLKIIAKSANGDLVSSHVALKGVVSSVAQANGETVVSINGTQVPLDLISSVSAA